MIRVQQQRGVKLPEGVKSVARPSRWGNPYKIGELMFPHSSSRMVFAAESAVEWYKDHVDDEMRIDAWWLDPLRDATGLACYCQLGDPCHADVLIQRLDQPLKETS